MRPAGVLDESRKLKRYGVDKHSGQELGSVVAPRMRESPQYHAA